MANVGSIDVAIRGDLRHLQAAFNKGERAVAAFGTQTDKRVRQIEARFGHLGVGITGLNKNIMALGRALGPAALGIGAGLGLDALVDSAKEATRSFAEIGREAKRAGIAVEDFQELSFAALYRGVSMDALVDGIKELNLRADEWITTGAGPAAEAFQRIGFTASELAGKLRDPVSLLDAIIERMRGLETAAQIRIADELFGGTGGEQFVRFLADGAKGMAALRREARELGLVISADVIANADEMTRKLDVASQVVDTNLKQAFIEITPLIVQTAQAIAGVAREVNRLIDTFKNLEDRSTRSLTERAMEIRETLKQFQRGGPRQAVAEATGRIDELEAEKQQIEEILFLRHQEEGTQANLNRLRAQEFALSKQSSGVQRDRAADVIANLQFELDQLGRTTDSQRLYNELLRAGVTLESEQGQAIAAAVSALQAKEAALDDTAKATERAAALTDYLGQTLTDGLSSIIVRGDDATDVIQRLALALADAALQASILGTGPLAGLFGSGGGILGAIGGLFTGSATLPTVAPGYLYHSGGKVGAGSPRQRRVPASAFISAPRFHAGLSSNEFAAVLEKGEHVLTSRMAGRTASLINGLSTAVAAGAESGPSVLQISVDVSGARGNKEIQEMVQRGVSAGIRVYNDRALPTRVKEITNEGLRRGDIG